MTKTISSSKVVLKLCLPVLSANACWILRDRVVFAQWFNSPCLQRSTVAFFSGRVVMSNLARISFGKKSLLGSGSILFAVEVGLVN